MKYKISLRALFFFMLAVTPASAVLNDADLYYSFDDADLSGSDPLDLSGNGYDGVTTGATTGVSGKILQAFFYDGAGDVINVTGYTDNNQDFTVGAWVNFNDLTTKDSFIASRQRSSAAAGTFWYMQMGGSGTSMVCGQRDAATAHQVVASHPMVINTWYHIVCRFDTSGNKIQLFIDGINTGTPNTDVFTPQTGVANVLIGERVDGFGDMDVEIDELFIYDRVLTNQEINDSYNSGTGFNPYASTIDVNSTLTVQANSTFDNSIVVGLCAQITNTTYNSSILCNSTGTDVYFDARTNPFGIGVYNISITSVGVGDNTTGNFSDNTTINYNWTSNQTAQVFTTPLGLNLIFLDEETRDSMSGTNVSVSVINANGNISDFVTSTGTISITDIFTEGEYTVRYTAENYSLRDFYFNLSLDDPETTETLYLLRESVYTPGTVSVRNFDGTNVENAQVIMSRYYGNDTIPNQVQMGTTDVNGNVVFVAESVTAFYTFRVNVNGVQKFIDNVPQLLTVDTTGLFGKTIILPAQGLDATASNTGFTYSFTPLNTVTNNTVQEFNTTINSLDWDLTGCTFTLYNALTGSALNTSTGFCSSSTGSTSLTYNVTNTSPLYVELVAVTSEFTNTYQKYFAVLNIDTGNFTVKTLADDISGFSGGRFNNFSRFLISLLVIIGVSFSLAGTSNFINNPEEMLFLAFVISLGFSYIDWMNLGIELMPVPELNQWFISIMLGLLAIIAGIRKFGVND
jgi:hypothetical protein